MEIHRARLERLLRANNLGWDEVKFHYYEPAPDVGEEGLEAAAREGGGGDAVASSQEGAEDAAAGCTHRLELRRAELLAAQLVCVGLYTKAPSGNALRTLAAAASWHAQQQAAEQRGSSTAWCSLAAYEKVLARFDVAPGSRHVVSRFVYLIDELNALHPSPATHTFPEPEASILAAVHAQPCVQEAILAFTDGEALHGMDTCSVCLETRPVFCATSPLSSEDGDGGEGGDSEESEHGSSSTPNALVPWRVAMDKGRDAKGNGDIPEGKGAQDDDPDDGDGDGGGGEDGEGRGEGGESMDVDDAQAAAIAANNERHFGRRPCPAGVCAHCRCDREVCDARGDDDWRVAGLFSGFASHSRDRQGAQLGGSNGLRLHNDMHFKPVPHYLRGLSTVEVALVARINSVQRIHLLKQGMLSSKGHCVAYQVEPKIAATLPLLGSQVGIVLLKRRNARGTPRAYHVRRQCVQEALLGLVHGPNADAVVPDESEYGAMRARRCWLSAAEHAQLQAQEPDVAKLYAEFGGPNVAADGAREPCLGRYYLHGYAPNRFFASVAVSHTRLQRLPADGPMPHLPTIDIAPVAKVPKTRRGPPTTSWTAPELQAVCRAAGKDASGTKKDMVARLNMGIGDDGGVQDGNRSGDCGIGGGSKGGGRAGGKGGGGGRGRGGAGKGGDGGDHCRGGHSGRSGCGENGGESGGGENRGENGGGDGAHSSGGDGMMLVRMPDGTMARVTQAEAVALTMRASWGKGGDGSRATGRGRNGGRRGRGGEEGGGGVGRGGHGGRGGRGGRGEKGGSSANNNGMDSVGVRAAGAVAEGGKGAKENADPQSPRQGRKRRVRAGEPSGLAGPIPRVEAVARRLAAQGISQPWRLLAKGPAATRPELAAQVTLQARVVDFLESGRFASSIAQWLSELGASLTWLRQGHRPVQHGSSCGIVAAWALRAMRDAAELWRSCNVGGATDLGLIHRMNAELSLCPVVAPGQLPNTCDLVEGDMVCVLRQLQPDAAVGVGSGQADVWCMISSLDQFCEMVLDDMEQVAAGGPPRRRFVALCNNMSSGTIEFGAPHWIAVVYEVGDRA